MTKSFEKSGIQVFQINSSHLDRLFLSLTVLVLLVIFMAFGMFGYLSFSSDIDDYRSPTFSFFNMMRFVVADMNYKFGPFFIFSIYMYICL